jgi:hypothetical protein
MIQKAMSFQDKFILYKNADGSIVWTPSKIKLRGQIEEPTPPKQDIIGLRHKLNLAKSCKNEHEASLQYRQEAEGAREQIRLLQLKMQRAFEKAKPLIGQAAILHDYADQADALCRGLEGIWHHWDNAGEKLTHPLVADFTNQIEDWSKPETTMLSYELTQFRMLFQHQLEMVRLRFPNFSSNTLINGYPSNEEYLMVRMDLYNHAGFLRDLADRLLASALTQPDA